MHRVPIRLKHGSACVAPVALLLPVQLRFEASWFGDATIYLDKLRPAGTALSIWNWTGFDSARRRGLRAPFPATGFWGAAP